MYLFVYAGIHSIWNFKRTRSEKNNENGRLSVVFEVATEFMIQNREKKTYSNAEHFTKLHDRLYDRCI